MRLWFAAAALLLSALTLAQAAQAPHTEGPGYRLANGGRPPQRVPFPAIHDWHSLKITLRRTMCFGACPSYHVEIDGDGHVSYVGEANVAVKGDASAQISRSAVRRLYNAFREAQFFWLYDAYRAPITDLPEYHIGISYDGHSMDVVDYMGQGIGMPRAVSDLEQLIDKTAGTDRWVKTDSAVQR